MNGFTTKFRIVYVRYQLLNVRYFKVILQPTLFLLTPNSLNIFLESVYILLHDFAKLIPNRWQKKGGRDPCGRTKYKDNNILYI